MWSRRVESTVLSARYEAAPQLREYDTLAPRVHPWVAMSAPRGVRSAVVSTDADGFRRTPGPRGVVDCETVRSNGIVLGGSFVFGVGAEDDSGTITGHLSSLTGLTWRNLGIRAGTSTHEIIAALPYLEVSDHIVVVSGANNLIASLQTLRPYDRYGPLFFEETLRKLGTTSMYDLSSMMDGEDVPPQPAYVSPRHTDEVSYVDRRGLAIDRQLRDLRLLSRMAGSSKKILFCVQPFADKVSRAAVPEEQPLLGLHDRQLGESWELIREYALAIWPGYAAALGRGCEELGVQFVNLSAESFTGWSFVDRLHCRSDGYKQAAQVVASEIAC